MSDWYKLIRSQLELVRELHATLGIAISDRPLMDIPPDLMTLRKNLIREEFEEVIAALDMPNNSLKLMQVAKELADLIVVVNGTAVSFGIPLDEVFEEVHRSNMSKLDDEGKPIYREDGKVLKGPNYKPPDLAKIIWPIPYKAV